MNIQIHQAIAGSNLVPVSPSPRHILFLALVVVQHREVIVIAFGTVNVLRFFKITTLQEMSLEVRVELIVFAGENDGVYFVQDRMGDLMT